MNFSLKKMVLYLLFSIILMLAVAVISFLLQPEFGSTAIGERLERIRHSKNFKDEKFKNDIATTVMTGNDNMVTSMWKFLFDEKPKNLRPEPGEVKVIKSDLKNLSHNDLYVWFGHSSFLLQLSGKTILVDPVFYKGSPVSFINPMFPGTDYYKPEMMPEVIDYLLISHDHWDHLDYQTIIELRSQVRNVVCPLGVGEDFEKWGYKSDLIKETDWNEAAEIQQDSIIFHCLSTRHFSGRGPWNPKTMPASWLIATPSRNIFYSGDGGYSDRFKQFGKNFPNIDLAIMENGQYDKNWNQIHTMPTQLGREIKELGAKRFTTVHHSKFSLANHPWNEPLLNEQKAAQEYGLTLMKCSIGEIVYLDK